MTSSKRTDRNQYKLPFDAARQERQTMIRAIAWQRTQLTRKRWSNAVEVLCYLVSIEGEHGTFPKQSTIANKCRMSTRTVKRVNQDLVTLGILISKRRGSTSNAYTIDFAKLASPGVTDGPILAHQPGQFGLTAGPKWPIGIKRNYL